jgi:Fibritin C-terminal region.
VTDIKEELEKFVRLNGSDWIGEMYLWLGDGNTPQVVETGIPGVYWARYANAQPIQVKNAINAPPFPDLHVRVRRSRIEPSIWQITDIIEDYLTPAGQGGISAHHEQHEEEGFDRGTFDRKQIKQLSIRVSDTWKVQVFGATAPTATGIALIDHAELDLASYVITAGAKFVGIEVNDSGTLSLHDGTVFGSIAIATAANIPVPDPGKYLLGYVQFYDGQTALADSDVRVVMPLPVIPKTAAYQIHEATAKTTPVDADEFPLADSAASWGIKKVTFANIKATLKTYFDTLYASLAAYITDAPSDGEIYGRKNAAWVLAQNEGHSHGLVRWTGVIGDTTFEYPDLVGSIEWVAINGLGEDPSVYSLSSDGSQLVLDTALASADVVTSGYILASL